MTLTVLPATTADAPDALPETELILVPIGELHPHPAQMRSHYDGAEMATLTLQVATHGLDAWQPLLVAPAVAGGYRILSGHRRRMAQLFAWHLADEPGSPPPDVERVTAALEALSSAPVKERAFRP